MAPGELDSECAHCGLPVTAARRCSSPLYCCHACILAARIIGGRDGGDHAWHLLRLGVGALLAMNIMMVSLLLYTGAMENETVPTFRLVLFVLAVPALAVLLPPLVTASPRSRSVHLHLLVACGSLAAFAVSAANTFRHYGEIYYDTATMLPLLVTFGTMIEATARTGTAGLLKSMERLLPERALLESPEGVVEVPVAGLKPGDLVRVRPGERMPVDGTIREGVTSIEEALFTGEYLPRTCGPGDAVLAGTVNGPGALLVQAVRTGSELLLHRVTALVRAARRNRSATERMAERVARWFLPAVAALAAAAGIFWWWSGDSGRALLSTLSVLVVACPCTMGIATPVATALAVARAAREGVVVRGGDVMERLGQVETLFLDKTGTVTMGRPVVREVQVEPPTSADELLGRLAGLEAASEHPLARAVLREAARRGLDPGTAREVRVVPAGGISGLTVWRGISEEVFAGTAAFTGSSGEGSAGSCSEVNVSWGGRHRGRVLFCDTLRPEAPAAVARLRKLRVPTVLASGDLFAAAAASARDAGIDRVEAPRTPEQKQRLVLSAAANGKVVAMAGDGINDAPAVAAATVGIAFGGSLDFVRQAGTVVILPERLTLIPWLISLSRRTQSIIRQNFAWSFGYNMVALAAAAAGILHPLVAAGAMVISSLTVLGNSLRIGRFPGDTPCREKACDTAMESS